LQFDEPFRSDYIDESNAPLYPFGFGMSYTTYTYADLQVETPEVDLDGILCASARVTNAGQRAGREVVQLYVRDLVASVTRPVRELKGFQSVWLEPGESQTARFRVPVTELGFHGLDNQYVVEPGEFALWIGPSSADGLEGRFRVV
jgi:beta-glucosidase